jgi:hypothetical protein
MYVLLLRWRQARASTVGEYEDGEPGGARYVLYASLWHPDLGEPTLPEERRWPSAELTAQYEEYMKGEGQEQMREEEEEEAAASRAGRGGGGKKGKGRGKGKGKGKGKRKGKGKSAGKKGARKSEL